ncbi:MAG: DUF6782 family putative metallopeptidase [Alphaproteobacteria bacterium]
MGQNKETAPLKKAIAGKSSGSDNAKVLKDISERLSKDSEAAALLQEAKTAGYKIIIKKGLGFYGSADPEKKRIYLNPDFKNDVLIGTLAHELRHIHQYGRGVDPDIEQLDSKSYLMQNRAIEADAEAFGVAVCKNLASMGDEGPLNSYKENAPNIVDAFEGELKKTGDMDKSRFAAFKSWYGRKQLVDIYDALQADDLDNIEDYDYCSFARKLSAKKIVDMVCDNGKKGSYFNDSPSLLETDEFLAMSGKNKKRITEFFEDEMVQEYELSDNSVKKIPTRQTNKTETPKKQKVSVEKAVLNKAILANKSR